MGGDPFKDLIDFIEFMLVSRNLFQIRSKCRWEHNILVLVVTETL